MREWQVGDPEGDGNDIGVPDTRYMGYLKEDEEDDILQKISDYFYQYLNADNSKNYIIGKKREFSYYYASLLQSFAKKNGYEDLLTVLSDEKINGEDIYTMFFILNASLPYLHKNYLLDNYNTITQGALKYIDNLSNSQILLRPFIKIRNYFFYIP